MGRPKKVVSETTVPAAVTPTTPTTAVVKRKRGRPVGSRNKPKPVVA